MDVSCRTSAQRINNQQQTDHPSRSRGGTASPYNHTKPTSSSNRQLSSSRDDRPGVGSTSSHGKHRLSMYFNIFDHIFYKGKQTSLPINGVRRMSPENYVSFNRTFGKRFSLKFKEKVHDQSFCLL